MGIQCIRNKSILKESISKSINTRLRNIFLNIEVYIHAWCLIFCKAIT